MSVNPSWSRFLALLEESQECEAVLQFECKGAFLKFRSKLIRVERPAWCSAEATRRFGVVPHHVALAFANGVRVNLYMRHVECVAHRDEGVVISFRGEENGKNSIAFYPMRLRKDFAG